MCGLIRWGLGVRILHVSNKDTIFEEGNGKSPHKIPLSKKKLGALSLIIAALEFEYVT